MGFGVFGLGFLDVLTICESWRKRNLSAVLTPPLFVGWGWLAILLVPPKVQRGPTGRHGRKTAAGRKDQRF